MKQGDKVEIDYGGKKQAGVVHSTHGGEVQVKIGNIVVSRRPKDVTLVKASKP